jgi:hypothetical protein
MLLKQAAVSIILPLAKILNVSTFKFPEGEKLELKSFNANISAGMFVNSFDSYSLLVYPSDRRVKFSNDGFRMG